MKSGWQSCNDWGKYAKFIGGVNKLWGQRGVLPYYCLRHIGIYKL